MARKLNRVNRAHNIDIDQKVARGECDCIHCGATASTVLFSSLDNGVEPTCQRCADEFEDRYEPALESRTFGWGIPQPIIVF